MTAPRFLPAAVALAVVVTAGGAVALSRGAGGGDSQPLGRGASAPPVLHVVGTGAAAGVAGGAAPEVVGGGAALRLAGVLPTGPASASAYALQPSRAGVEDVRRIAGALGLTGTPIQRGREWVLASDAGRLVVRNEPGLPWSYGSSRSHGCATAPPTADDESRVACYAADKAIAAPRAAGSTVATGVLRRLGLSPTSSGRGMARAAPTVDGLATAGWDTWVAADDATGAVSSATGYAGRAVRGWTYPIVGAQEALRRLQSAPQPAIELCRVQPGVPGCAPPPARVVTGARLGLVHLHESRVGALLAPAWLFAIRGEATPLAEIAIADPYLAAPTPPPMPDGDPVPGGEPTTVPGSTGGEPTSVPGTNGGGTSGSSGSSGGGGGGGNGGTSGSTGGSEGGTTQRGAPLEVPTPSP